MCEEQNELNFNATTFENNTDLITSDCYFHTRESDKLFVELVLIVAFVLSSLVLSAIIIVHKRLKKSSAVTTNNYINNNNNTIAI